MDWKCYIGLAALPFIIAACNAVDLSQFNLTPESAQIILDTANASGIDPVQLDREDAARLVAACLILEQSGALVDEYRGYCETLADALEAANAET